MNISELEKQLKLSFTNHSLLRQAFTHSSYVNEHQGSHVSDNERLEFLGDAVLELAVSDYLYNQRKDLTEGEMTKLRAAIVCEASLVNFAKSLEFGHYLLLGKGEEQSGGRERPALLADVFESFLGALFLDQGFDGTLRFLETHIFPKISIVDFLGEVDYKSQLQEAVQQSKNASISYQIISDVGPSHNKAFIAEVKINNDTYQGEAGRTKKEAEQRAAKRALDRILPSLS